MICPVAKVAGFFQITIIKLQFSDYELNSQFANIELGEIDLVGIGDEDFFADEEFQGRLQMVGG